MPTESGKVSEQEKAELSKQRGQAAASIKDPEERRKFIAAQGDTEAKKKDLPVLDYQQLSREASTQQAIGSYKKGTDNVPKTGNYELHEGEAVLTKKENEARKKKKHLHAITTTKAKDGSFVHEHHYKDSPDDEKTGKPVFGGTSATMEDLHAHMDDHLGAQQGEPDGDEQAQAGEPDGDEQQPQAGQ